MPTEENPRYRLILARADHQPSSLDCWSIYDSRTGQIARFQRALVAPAGETKRMISRLNRRADLYFHDFVWEKPEYLVTREAGDDA